MFKLQMNDDRKDAMFMWSITGIGALLSRKPPKEEENMETTPQAREAMRKLTGFRAWLWDVQEKKKEDTSTDAAAEAIMDEVQSHSFWTSGLAKDEEAEKPYVPVTEDEKRDAKLVRYMCGFWALVPDCFLN